MCPTLEYLVSGPVPVPDGAMTATSVASSPEFEFGPAQARLNQEFGVHVRGWTKPSAGRWCPSTNNINELIQVDFNI